MTEIRKQTAQSRNRYQGSHTLARQNMPESGQSRPGPTRSDQRIGYFPDRIAEEERYLREQATQRRAIRETTRTGSETMLRFLTNPADEPDVQRAANRVAGGAVARREVQLPPTSIRRSFDSEPFSVERFTSAQRKNLNELVIRNPQRFQSFSQWFDTIASLNNFDLTSMSVGDMERFIEQYQQPSATFDSLLESENVATSEPWVQRFETPTDERGRQLEVEQVGISSDQEPVLRFTGRVTGVTPLPVGGESLGHGSEPDSAPYRAGTHSNAQSELQAAIARARAGRPSAERNRSRTLNPERAVIMPPMVRIPPELHALAQDMLERNDELRTEVERFSGKPVGSKQLMTSRQVAQAEQDRNRAGSVSFDDPEAALERRSVDPVTGKEVFAEPGAAEYSERLRDEEAVREREPSSETSVSGSRIIQRYRF